MKIIKTLWKEIVKKALENLGGRAHLSEIYKAVGEHQRTEENPNWKAKVRQVVQMYNIFYQEKPRSGVWFLREERPPEEFDPIKNPVPNHEDVQGMLLEIGKIYGYETIVPSYDINGKFLDKTLGEIVTIRKFPQFSYPKIIKTASLIDVMWFDGEPDMWIPRYAFEVEHSTDITKGLVRLMELYNSGINVNLFVITPESKLNKFETEVNKTTFRDIRGSCRSRTYNSLIGLYNLALEHDDLKNKFLG